jgi:DNA repair exonuclease SbcCD nuclease subunit
MSKIISIGGDFHLNLRDKNTASWERGRYLALMETFAADASDIVIFSGDVFDKANATLEEISVFFEGIDIIKAAGKEIYIIEGNHEEISDKLTTFDMLPQAGFTKISAHSLTFEGVNLWLVGHPKINIITSSALPLDKTKKNILISHYRSDIGFAQEEVSNAIVSEKFDDTILSDIHYRLQPAPNIRYTSSPYGIHYTPEKEYGYCMLELSDGDYKITDVNLTLPSKIKITCTKKELPSVLEQLDPQNMYKLDITGEVDAEALKSLKDTSCVSKFMFNDASNDNVEDVADELLVTMHKSLSEVIVVALGDLELTDEELELAKKILKEEL